MHFRTPSGGMSKTLSWSSMESELCSGSTIQRLHSVAYSLAASSMVCMSVMPDRKINMSPRSLSGYVQINVYGGRHEDYFESLTLFDQAFENAEQKVGEYVSLMHFVYYNYVILGKLSIALNLTKQYSFGEEQNFCVLGTRFVEANLSCKNTKVMGLTRFVITSDHSQCVTKQ
ncbi:hypothetical protein BpHYR1_019221 [Brachionus plicatilis]|uniref:Uncharacterized protein n=1 Tax=Brachionus plicatilis TaxID=10195 RepID=A0A3M7QHD2_BRAPC|nr:hypothetical protein BpHYR1_019221 [Brachionus plicatilis]